ncbi:BQ2448_1796 [Microbotryum intermedium]|uniref:BQ2448_1796 protein n=1 Tax=Microbotryum intermedium TaxID=269621 RepID=A0A238F952_9BASI|nr:BQ2448_1796 [Microbotryum intermedium]
MAARDLPLAGVRVLELAGLAPGPYAGMVLSDFGADVVRVDRADTTFSTDVLSRNKRSISVSLKSPSGLALLRTLLSASAARGCSNPKCKCSQAKQANCKNNPNTDVWRADVLIDPFRPGVLERLGLGPDVLLAANRGLIIARLTGFRREGPYSKMAGHDINYSILIEHRRGADDALGTLTANAAMLGRKDDKPYFPANLLADFAGGGIMAVVGILMALLSRHNTGRGQVVEIDMVTGTRYISSFPLMMSRPSLGFPIWDRPRGENLFDGGAPWYDVYETSDGGYMSVGALENHFYTIFINRMLENAKLGHVPNPAPTPNAQMDRSTWPDLEGFLTATFKTKTRGEWTKIFLDTDACCVPVLNRNEIDQDGVGKDEPGTRLTTDEFENGDGGVPGPAPKLDYTPARGPGDNTSFLLTPGKDTRSVLKEAGFEKETNKLIEEGAVEIGEDDDEGDIKAKL